jgi:ATP-dependent DNA helicase RecG
MEAITNYRIEYLEISGISIDIPFKMVSGFRDDNPEHLQVLREALVNLIIHTDYFSRANPRIRVFSDRFKFFNPGSLPKKIEYILEEDFSLPRNPIIAKIFRFIRLAESIGSGFHKMIEGWEQHYGIKPVIEGDFDYYKITFPNVPKKLGEKLGENEIKIIELMKENKYITTKELSGHIKISTTAIDKNISKLKKKGILKRIGPAKGGYWKVVEK